MLIKRIERYLRGSLMAPTAFGREAAGDTNFVAQLRRGRRPRPELERRIEAWLDAAEAELERTKCRRR